MSNVLSPIFNFKAIGKIKLNRNHGLILSLNINSIKSFINYSATTKKINYYTQLFNSNRKKNLFSVKNYSTSIFLSDNNDSSKYKEETLDPIKFENWSKEQVCSLLCTEKENGGAGLHFDEVKPLYDTGLNGDSLNIVITNIQETGKEHALNNLKDKYKSVGVHLTFVFITVLENVVNWANNLLKTRLYNLWSPIDLKNQLCKSVTKGGAGLQTELFDSNELSSQEIIELVADFKEFIEWKRSLLLKPKRIDINTFINNGILLEDYSGAIPYQNNKNNALKVGETLLYNVEIKESKAGSRHLVLLNNFAYFGFGKTRFGIQFLDIWKNYLAENPNEEQCLIERYGQNVFNKVYNSELIYINLTDPALKLNDSTLNYLRNIVPQQNDSTYFVVIDEYPAFCDQNNQSPLLQTMYDIWISTIFHIQKLPNVVGVYVCGKGAFIDVFGKSDISSGIKRSPSLCHRIELHTLTIQDVRNIFNNYPKVKQMLIERGIYEFTLKEIMDETAGIPILIDRLISTIVKRPTPQTVDDVLLCCKQLETEVPEVIFYPFSEAAKESFSYQVYSFLMFISFMIPLLDTNKKFNSKIFGLDKIEDLKFLPSVDISTLAVSLNCYVESNGSGARLVFPRKTIRKYISFTPHFSIKPFVQMIPQMLDKGAVFEILMGSFIIWMTKCGFIQNLTFSKVFPFLANTALENILCVDLNSNEIATKVTKKETKMDSEKNAINFWKGIHLNYHLYQNKLNFVKEKSFGPEKFVVFEQDLWWLMQDKNTNKFDFSELAEEIQNLSVFPETVHIIFTIFYRCKVDLQILYSEQSSIFRPVKGRGRISEIKEIKVPKNVTVVIVDETNVKNVIGVENFVALSKLADTQPHGVHLI
ncbi:hypothetical protein ABK040_000599 [Willaertia magna]